jgi:inhibitor of cysteine peptidase
MKHIVDDTFNSGSITVQKGDLISIQLPEVPTAGYRWEEEHAESATGEKYICESDGYEPAPAKAVGGAQIRTFNYRIAKVGEGVIKLINRRSWSKTADKTFEIKIVAK